MSAPAGARRGILGGTFNPPHRGHLALARQAREQLDLEDVVLMPAGVSPHKAGGADPGAEHRLNMCRLAAGESSGLSVCALELRRRGPSYTVDTLRHIKQIEPQARLTFIVGADMARTLPTWHESAALAELADFAVAGRRGVVGDQVLDALDGLGGYPELSFLDMAPVDVSSSTVRECVARGESVVEFVGEPVAAYIVEQGLYREARELGS